MQGSSRCAGTVNDARHGRLGAAHPIGDDAPAVLIVLLTIKMDSSAAGEKRVMVSGAARASSSV